MMPNKPKVPYGAPVPECACPQCLEVRERRDTLALFMSNPMARASSDWRPPFTAHLVGALECVRQAEMAIEVPESDYARGIKRAIEIASATVPAPDGPRPRLADEIVHALGRELGWA